jgi:hypothetical protein
MEIVCKNALKTCVFLVKRFHVNSNTDQIWNGVIYYISPHAHQKLAFDFPIWPLKM